MKIKTIKNRLNFKYVLIVAISSQLAAFLSSCESFLEIEPPVTSLPGNRVFTNDATATAAVIGVYSRMIEGDGGFASGTGSIALETALASDEYQNHSSIESQIQFFQNELLARNNRTSFWWRQFYSYIFTVNSVLNGLNASEGVTAQVRGQLEGEAKFIRAFCYFYLVNLFGDVPYITTTDFAANAEVSRDATAEVYNQIISDLQAAQALLGEEYVSEQRIRPNKSTATALLARVYLYLDDWSNAESEATAVINSGFYNLENDLNNIFLKESSETIWQLRPVFDPRANTFEVDAFNFFGGFPQYYASMREELVNAFENEDNRKTIWVGSLVDGADTFYYANKYRFIFSDPVVEYLVVFRLTEQYLIRAEARAQLGNIVGAQEDLDIIRNRAGLANTNANDGVSLLSAIEQERRVELFTEWGHRWLDLKRTHRADPVLSLVKPNWEATDALFPIPQSERERNKSLTQNLGY